MFLLALLLIPLLYSICSMMMKTRQFGKLQFLTLKSQQCLKTKCKCDKFIQNCFCWDPSTSSNISNINAWDLLCDTNFSDNRSVLPAHLLHTVQLPNIPDNNVLWPSGLETTPYGCGVQLKSSCSHWNLRFLMA